MNLFPPEVARKEIAFYLTKQNQYGLPLDNRKDYTKLDWVVWTATLADNAGGFRDARRRRSTSSPTSTPSRVPLTDWYDTDDRRSSLSPREPPDPSTQLHRVLGGAHFERQWSRGFRQIAAVDRDAAACRALYTQEHRCWREHTRRRHQGVLRFDEAQY